MFDNRARFARKMHILNSKFDQAFAELNMQSDVETAKMAYTTLMVIYNNLEGFMDRDGMETETEECEKLFEDISNKIKSIVVDEDAGFVSDGWGKILKKYQKLYLKLLNVQDSMGLRMPRESGVQDLEDEI